MSKIEFETAVAIYPFDASPYMNEEDGGWMLSFEDEGKGPTTLTIWEMYGETENTMVPRIKGVITLTPEQHNILCAEDIREGYLVKQ